MAKYAYVNEGVVSELYEGLPTSWRNISGMNLLENDIQTLNSLGWFVVESNNIEINERTHKKIDTQYQVSYNSVIESPVIVELTQQEKDDKFQEFKNNFLMNIRGRRNQLLRDCEWTQATDLMEIRNQSWINTWKDYRQTLRDLPNRYKNFTTYEEFDSNPLIWPNIPVE
jgi:hypothetical protein